MCSVLGVSFLSINGIVHFVNFLEPLLAMASDDCASETRTAMTERGGFAGFLLRLFMLLLLLGVASLLLQGWASSSWRFFKERHGQNVTHKLGKSARNMKDKNVAMGEVAGQGMPGRMQCSRDNWSITSIEVSGQRMVPRLPCLFSESESVSFVTLFVLPEAEGTNKRSTEHEIEEKRPSLRKLGKDKLHAVLRTFLESIQVSMPNRTQVTIITNQSKASGEFLQNIDWRLIPAHKSRIYLMLQRLESYIDLLESMMERRKSSSSSPIMHLIFSDFDMIVVDDLGCVFKDYPFFDVALTFRNNRRQPINSGVIMVRGTLESLSRGKLLLKEVVKVYRAKFMYATGVLGDQLAITEVIKETVQAQAFQGGVPFEASVMATKTLFLPCAIYNWTPPEGAGQFHGMPTEVKVLHFKGSRKRLMLQAWSLYKRQNTSDLSNMKCFILKSGRSKYDF